MATPSKLTEQLFFNDRSNDTRPCQWVKLTVQNTGSGVVPVDAANDELLDGVLIGRREPLVGVQQGGHDVAAEIIDFITETAVFHRTIDPPLAASVPDINEAGYALQSRIIELLTNYTVPLGLVGIDTTGMVLFNYLAPGRTVNPLFALTVSMIGDVVSSNGKTREQIVESAISNISGAAPGHARYVAFVGELRASVFTPAVTNAVTTSIPGVQPADFNDLLSVVVHGYAKAIATVHAHREWDLGKQLFDQQTLASITVAGWRQFFLPQVVPQIIAHAVQRDFTTAIKQLARFYNPVSTATLAQNPEAQQLQQALVQSCTNPTTMSSVCKFYTTFLQLLKFDSAQNTWAEVSIATPIAAGDLANYRLNLRKSGAGTEFENSLPVLRVPPYTGLLYHKAANAVDRVALGSDDEHALRIIYNAVYTAAVSDVVVTVALPSGAQLNLRVKPLDEYTDTMFSFSLREVMEKGWKQIEARQTSFTNPPSGTVVGYVGNDASVYRSADGKWKRVNPATGKLEDYDFSIALADNNGAQWNNPCAIAGLNGDAATCSKFLVDLPSLNDPDKLAKFIASLNSPQLFASHRDSIARMHPQIRFDILKAFGFRSTNADTVINNRPIRRVQTVDEWLTALPDGTLSGVVRSSAPLMMYLSELVTSTNNYPGIVNSGLYDKTAAPGASAVSAQLGIQDFPSVNPMRLPSNAFNGIASLAASRSVASLPAMGSTVLIGVPAIAPRSQAGGSAFDEFEANFKNKLEGGQLEKMFFDNAVAELERAGKVLKPEDRASITKNLNDMIRLEAQIVPQIAALNFAKRAMSVMGDRTAEVLDIVDLQNMEANYKKISKDYLGARRNYYTAVSGIHAACEEIERSQKPMPSTVQMYREARMNTLPGSLFGNLN